MCASHPPARLLPEATGLPAQPLEPLTRQVPESLQSCSAYTALVALPPLPYSLVPLSTLRTTHSAGLWG